MLEKLEFQKQEVINERHVTDLINRKDQYKSHKKLPECEAASYTVPDGDHAHAEDHQNTKDKKCPSDSPCPVK